MTIQATGGTRKTIEAGRRAHPRHAADRSISVERETLPASELMLALQCGGSDGYSGITANPALGAAADILVRNGGTAILSETPEIYGAEHLLTRRAATPEIGHKLVERIHWWEDYTARNGGEMNNNPSPGNKAGRPDDHPRKVARRGRQGRHDARSTKSINTPSRSPPRASSSWTRRATIRSRRPARSRAARTCSCFTTGRGSAYGCKPTPSIKLATNSDTYRRMIEDMDINCGDVLDGVSIEEKGQEIFDKVLERRFGRTHQVRRCSAMATRNSRPGRSARRCERGDHENRAAVRPRRDAGRQRRRASGRVSARVRPARDRARPCRTTPRTSWAPRTR